MFDVLIAHADTVRDVAVPGATSGLQGEGLEGTTLRHPNHGGKVRLGLTVCTSIPSCAASSLRVRTQTGKPGKWKGIFYSGKSLGNLKRLEEFGEITQSTGKQGISDKCYLLFLVIFK